MHSVNLLRDVIFDYIWYIAITFKILIYGGRVYVQITHRRGRIGS